MSDAKKDAAADSPKAGGGKKKMIVIALAAIVLLGGGGGGAWWFLGRGGADEAAQAAKEEEKRKATRAFVTLDPFVVNLADAGSDRYAQIGVVLEVEGKEANQKVTDRMPAVRNQILLLISSKQAQDLMSREGKEKLADEIGLVTARQVGWTPEDERGDDGDDEPPPKAKTKDGKDGKAKSAKARKPPPPTVPNPITQVHFASFIVQ